MSAPTNTDFTLATSLGVVSTTATTVTQTVDDAGTTYTVYYSFQAPTNAVVMSASAFGDLTVYTPITKVYVGPASAPTELLGASLIAATNRPIQFPVTPGSTYFLEIIPNIGNPTPATLTLRVAVAPTNSVPTGSVAIPDDTDLFPLAFVSGTDDYTALKYIQNFPAGEQGDTLIDGTVLMGDDTDNTLHLFNSSYQEIATSSAQSRLVRVRTCLGANTFYIAVNSNPVVFLTCTATGTFSSTTTMTAITSNVAVAASNDETVLYHAQSGSGQAVRRWLIGTGAGTNLAAGITNYNVTDILVLSDNSIVVGYTKLTATRDYQVKRYDASGTTLNTYTGFDSPMSGASPRLTYAIDDPLSFWVMNHPASTAGLIQLINVRVSDGTFLTTRLHEQFELGAYQGAATATPVAYFGASFSCPFWIVRASVAVPTPTSGRRGIYVPTRGVAGSEGGGANARFQDLNGYPSTATGFSATVAGRIIHVQPDGPVGGPSSGLKGLGKNRAIYVPTIGIGGAEGDGRDSEGSTVGIRRIVVYDGEGYTHR